MLAAPLPPLGPLFPCLSHIGWVPRAGGTGEGKNSDSPAPVHGSDSESERASLLRAGRRPGVDWGRTGLTVRVELSKGPGQLEPEPQGIQDPMRQVYTPAHVRPPNQHAVQRARSASPGVRFDDGDDRDPARQQDPGNRLGSPSWPKGWVKAPARQPSGPRSRSTSPARHKVGAAVPPLRLWHPRSRSTSPMAATRLGGNRSPVGWALPEVPPRHTQEGAGGSCH